MKAVKTKSGKWQVRPVDHYEKKDGKRRVITACITRETKAEALRAGYEYEQNRKKKERLTFDNALAKYIELKRPVLSPATVRGYETLQKNAYAPLCGVLLDDVTNALLQAWVSSYAATHSPKTVRNAYALVSAVFDTFRPSTRFRVTLPQKQPPKLTTPTETDIKALLESIRDTALDRAVLLSAVGSLRRGEACAVTYADINGCYVTVNKSMNYDGLVKAPKNPQSIRTVKFPPEVIERLTAKQGKPNEKIVGILPNSVTRQFERELKKLGLSFRFHDLRVYAISVRHALGIPDQYIMRDSGHLTDATLKQIYRRALDDKREEFADVVNGYFAGLA